jgi:hypothetical protein
MMDPHPSSLVAVLLLLLLAAAFTAHVLRSPVEQAGMAAVETATPAEPSLYRARLVTERQAIREAVSEHSLSPAPELSQNYERFLRLADCESGNWLDGGAAFEVGSARWGWAKPGAAVPPWGTTYHHGGLQFLPATWDWVAPMVGLDHIAYAYDASTDEQIQVAEKVLDLQGWGAWPVCSKKVR